VSSILVVDDERGIRALCGDVLGRAGYEVETVDSAAGAIAAVTRRRFDLILCDINLPDQDGVSLLPRLLAPRGDDTPPPAVLLITAYPSIDTAVRGMKLGARDYLGKPFSPDELRLVVRRALDEDELRRAHGELTKRLAYGSMIGDSPAMQQLRATIDKVAQSDATVLIAGESGTGKELVARALHFAGRRASRAFMPVNCGALVGTLLDSELFGHTRGAFTGADTAKRGLFVAADSGTLFLDEIGELPLELQPKLLRALQDGEVKPVGGTASIRVDARVIAATNRTLTDGIKNGTFREDLYYRLAVVPIEMPPLRGRREDIPVLAEHFLQQVCADNMRKQKRIVPSAMTLLMQHDWPGNVRELKNVVERLAILTGDAELITEADVGDALPRVKSVKAEHARGTPFKDLVAAAERDIIIAALEANDHHVSNTARELQLERSHLYKKMRALGIDHRADEEAGA